MPSLVRPSYDKTTGPSRRRTRKVCSSLLATSTMPVLAIHPTHPPRLTPPYRPRAPPVVRSSTRRISPEMTATSENRSMAWHHRSRCQPRYPTFRFPWATRLSSPLPVAIDELLGEQNLPTAYRRVPLPLPNALRTSHPRQGRQRHCTPTPRRALSWLYLTDLGTAGRTVQTICNSDQVASMLRKDTEGVASTVLMPMVLLSM
jgi:hypothetical protein